MISKQHLLAATLISLLPSVLQAQQDPQLIGEGARVYATNCTRCHNARSSMERTDAQWGLIVAHMRARANFTRGEALAVLAYLQATNLPENAGDGVASSVVPRVLPSDFVASLQWPRPPGR